MSDRPTHDPVCSTTSHEGAIAAVVDARPRDLGGFVVGRVLPSSARRTVGPFLYLDRMGPTAFAPGTGLDVPPHPHIGLCTVTYLFEGEILHRDSVGSVQPIRPGAVNWMTAGRGIVHSERTGLALRRTGSRLDGLQAWVALPKEDEACDPGFVHVPGDAVPTRNVGSARIRLLVGRAFGLSAPVGLRSPAFYADVAIDEAGSPGEVALPDEHEERAVYVVSGEVTCGAERAPPGRMWVLAPGRSVRVEAEAGTRFVVLGGARLPEPRHLWWNFAASDPSRLEAAKAAWRDGRFPAVPGDDERVPLPAR